MKYKKLNIVTESIYDNNDKEIGVVIKFSDFQRLMDKLEDLHDIYDIYKRRRKVTKTISLEQAKKELFGEDEKK